MGTRSLALLFGAAEKHYVTIYRQFDGYPSSMGADLAKVSNRIITNGISTGFSVETHANGFSELAAKIVMALKAENMDGGIYLSTIKSLDDDFGWAEYVYVIKADPENSISTQFGEAVAQVLFEGYEVEGNGLGKKLFSLHPSKFEEWMKASQDAD